jgi:hypothetical protein
MPIKADKSLGTVDDLLANRDSDAGSIRDASGNGRDLVLVFRTQKDGRVRPEHAALEGRVWELDDPDAPSPPIGPGCRCEVVIARRGDAERRENETPAESLDSFKRLESNLSKVYPDDVVEAFTAGKLKPEDLIIRRTGDRINTAQARAIIASREAGVDPKGPLKAVSELADKGLSGRILTPIVKDARERMAQGASAHEAARASIMATPQRGYVTAAQADAAADSMVRSRLLDGVDHAPSPAKGVPAAAQEAQRSLEGRPLIRPTVDHPLGEVEAAPDVPKYVQDAERQIARRTTERLLAWDADGNLVASAEGKAGSVDIPKGIPQGATITHNHPSAQKYAADTASAWGTSLSRADVIAARNLNAEAIRAVSPSGLVSEMRRPPGGWPSREVMTRETRVAYKDAMRQLLTDVRARRITPEQADAVFLHRVNEAVAKAIGARYRWGAYE